MPSTPILRTAVLTLTIALSLTAVLVGDPAPESVLPAETSGRFRDLVGVCQGNIKSPLLWEQISYNRLDIAWKHLQPKGPDQWNEDALRDRGDWVLQHRAKGVDLLPVLCYGTEWAGRKTPWTFSRGHKRFDVQAEQTPGEIRRQCIETDTRTGKTRQIGLNSALLPPDKPEYWENYVEKVVSFLRKEPYNVEYFQIWNEAHDTGTSFWVCDMDEYFKTIHLPAAKIIHKYGGKVVYGGWPCSGTLQQFVSLLDKYNAWDTIDVVDVHYFPISAMDYLYKHGAGQRNMAIWQTEIGFDGAPRQVPNMYPRLFYWGLTHGWRKDRYKIFWFAYASPADPKAYGYGKNFVTGDKLSPHGRALVVLSKLLDGPAVRVYRDWRTSPALAPQTNENASSVEAFHCGDRIVWAIHLVAQNGSDLFTDLANTNDSFHLSFGDAAVELAMPKLNARQVRSARRVGMFGSEVPLEVLPLSEAGGCVVSVPVVDPDKEEQEAGRSGRMHTFYVCVELSGQKTPATGRAVPAAPAQPTGNVPGTAPNATSATKPD